MTKSGKAAGPDGIPAGVFKAGGSHADEDITGIVSAHLE